MSSQSVTTVLNSVLSSAGAVIPMPLSPEAPTLITSFFEQAELGVLIGLTGDLRGRLILDANQALIAAIAEKMFGMPVQGEMLESFAGELGNMIAGHMATDLSQREVTFNITPPTVFVGRAKITGFKKGILVPVAVADQGKLNVVLTLEE